MTIKFRLKGLAETFIDTIKCPCCGHDGGDEGDDGFQTDLSRVTYDGIVAVIRCSSCQTVFVPEGQKFGVVNSQRLKDAVEKDSRKTGLPIFPTIESVRLEVEKLNASSQNKVH